MYGRSGRQLSFLDWFGGVSHCDYIRRKIAEGAGAGAEDGSIADCYAGADKGVGGDPAIFADRDRLSQQRIIPAGVIVCAGAQMSILAQERSAADFDEAEGIENCFIADGDVVADFQIPGDFDFDRSADAHVSAEFGAKHFQDRSAQAIPVVKGAAEDRSGNDGPKQPPELLFSSPGAEVSLWGHGNEGSWCLPLPEPSVGGSAVATAVSGEFSSASICEVRVEIGSRFVCVEDETRSAIRSWILIAGTADKSRALR